ncbi:MAG TPA: hypothetical protein VIT43_10975 [Candidatus Dormibacteraeota bacterium]
MGILRKGSAAVQQSARPTLSLIEKVGIGVLLGLLAAVLVGGPVKPVHATQARPTLDNNYYVRTTSSYTLQQLGLADGKRDSAGYQALIILDFGAQTTDGSTAVETGTYTPISNFQIRDMAQNFAIGYLAGGGWNLRLGIGTNNSRLPDQGTYGNYGTVWNTAVVAQIRSWMAGQGYSQWIQVEGANDIESWSGTGDGAHPTDDWANNYSIAGGSIYYNFGSADGCPYGTYDNRTGCSYGWAQADYYGVAWGYPAAFAVPEIYYYCTYCQWAMISGYGQYYTSTGGIHFTGPVDDHFLEPPAYTAADAWSLLWNTLNGDFLPANMTYETEMHVAS